MRRTPAWDIAIPRFVYRTNRLGRTLVGIADHATGLAFWREPWARTVEMKDMRSGAVVGGFCMLEKLPTSYHFRRDVRRCLESASDDGT